MPTPPLGILSTPRDKLRSILAETIALQTWFGVVNSTLAKAKIFYSLLNQQDLRTLFPFALIQWADFKMKQVTGGASNGLWPDQPSLRVLIADVDPGRSSIGEGGAIAPTDIMEGDVVFANQLSAVLADPTDDKSQPGLAELAALDDRLAITAIVLEHPPKRNPIEQWASDQPYMWASFLVHFE
jgi:hypothetical protein